MAIACVDEEEEERRGVYCFKCEAAVRGECVVVAALRNVRTAPLKVRSRSRMVLDAARDYANNNKRTSGTGGGNSSQVTTSQPIGELRAFGRTYDVYQRVNSVATKRR